MDPPPAWTPAPNKTIRATKAETIILSLLSPLPSQRREVVITTISCGEPKAA